MHEFMFPFFVCLSFSCIDSPIIWCYKMSVWRSTIGFKTVLYFCSILNRQTENKPKNIVQMQTRTKNGNRALCVESVLGSRKQWSGKIKCKRRHLFGKKKLFPAINVYDVKRNCVKHLRGIFQFYGCNASTFQTLLAAQHRFIELSFGLLWISERETLSRQPMFTIKETLIWMIVPYVFVCLYARSLARSLSLSVCLCVCVHACLYSACTEWIRIAHQHMHTRTVDAQLRSPSLSPHANVCGLVCDCLCACMCAVVVCAAAAAW